MSHLQIAGVWENPAWVAGRNFHQFESDAASVPVSETPLLSSCLFPRKQKRLAR
jgi:hypothetical protein